METRDNSRFIKIGVALLVTVLVIAGAFWLYWSRPRLVSFKYTRPASLTVEVYKAAKNEHGEPIIATGKLLASLSNTQQIKLTPGEYVATAKSTPDYAAIEESFKVSSDNTSVAIDPLFNVASLNRRLAGEAAAIDAVVAKRLGSTKYATVERALYRHGEWASVILTLGDLNDYFHLVLNKESGSWQTIGKPAIVLNSNNYPTVPYDILKLLNQKQFDVAGERE